jgi:branched-subunit amino acid ABC-type transport system permease component
LNTEWVLRLPFWGALPVSLVFAGLVGLAIERVVIRTFARQPMVVQIIVTLGLALLLTGLAQQFFGGDDLIVPNERAIFPRRAAFALGTVNISWERIGIIAIVVALAAAVYWFFRYTETGLAIRATATDQDVASLQGVSSRRLSVVSWGTGSVAAGLAGVMLASLVVASNPNLLFLLSIKGFAAAIVGGLISFPIAVGAGFAIGLGEEWVRHYLVSVNGKAFVGAPEVLTLGLVIAVLAARPSWIFRSSREEEDSGVIARSTGVETRLTRLIDPVEAYRLVRAAFGTVLGPQTSRRIRRAVLWVIGALALAFPLFPLPDFWTLPLNFTFIYLLVILSFVVLVGWLGQISLSLGAFVAVGGAGAAFAATSLNLPFPLPLFAGVLLSIPVSILVGLPALRLRGLHFAVVTLCFGLVAERAIIPRFDLSALLPRPGYLDSELERYYLFLACTAIAIGLAWRVSVTRTGRAFRAIRDSETVAVAYGIQPVRTKLTGFVISGAIAALAGTLLAYELGTVQSQYASVPFSIQWLGYAVVAGIISIGGPVVGALVFGLLPELGKGEVQAANISFWPEVFAGALLILIMAVNPGGLASMGRFLRTRISAHEVDDEEDLRAIRTAALDMGAEVGKGAPNGRRRARRKAASRR